MTRAKLYTYNDAQYTLKQLAKIAGLNEYAMRARLASGWDVKEAVETPIQHIRTKYEYKGKSYTITELARLNGTLSPSGVKYRLECGQSIAQIVETPALERRMNLQNRYVPPKRRDVDLTQCRTCQYRGGVSGAKESGLFCAYSLIEGHARMFISPPSPHCAVYVSGKSLLRQATLKQIAKGRLI